MSPEAALPDPDAIAGRTFNRARKGFEADEVRAYLVQLGSETRELLRELEDLRRRLAEAERRAADPRDLDEETVTELLGEETAKLLVDARRAAAEIRTRAEEEAASIRLDARDEATATREEADSYADAKRSLADEADEKIRADAEAYAAGMREAAERDTTAQRGEADEYARSTREAADAEVAAERARVQQVHDEQLAASEAVLAERTAEAEQAAEAIRAAAEQHRSETVAGADSYSADTRAAADAYAAETREAADASKAEAEAAAAEIRAAAEAEAADAVAAAKARGIEMVEEASEYRERVIADLAARRRTARAQLEQFASIRDALAVRLTDVRHQIERSHDELQRERIAPDEVGDGSVDRAALAPSPPEPAEDGDDDGGAEDVQAEDPEAAPYDLQDVGGEGGDPADAEPDLVAVEPDDDATGPAPDLDDPAEPEEPLDADDESHGDEAAAASEPSTGAAEDSDDAVDLDDATEVDDATDVDEAPVPAEAAGDADADADEPAGIDDLFARIRAEQDGDEDPTADDGADEDPADGDPVDGASAADEVEADQDVEHGEDADLDDQDADLTEDGGGADEELLELRDATTDELERQLARRLKRVLADEQNELLDLLRRTKGDPDPDHVLPAPDEHLDRYRSAALEDLRAAERAGAGFYGDAPDGEADVEDLARAFAEDLIRQIRGRLEGSFAVDAGEDEVADAIRSLYREWKTQRIAEIARHHVIVAFSRGVVEAAPEGSAFRWLVDHGGAASPDCDDNALEGAVVRGQEFPTGVMHPPVHPGCRCLLVPTGERAPSGA